MPAPKAFTGLLLVGAAAAAFVWRRRGAGPRERVDLYFSDGSMVSFARGTPEGDRLLPLARRALAAARG
jgi:hypothetical protein